MTATSDLTALLAPAGATYDGPPDSEVRSPHLVVHGGAPRPDDLCLSHRHLSTVTDWQVVCVSNNPAGARLLADAATRAVDGINSGAGYYRVTFVSPPIEDTTDPESWRWSSTVEVTLTTGRT